jgi:hypothetical protein
MREPGEPIQKSDLLRHDGSLEELIAKVSAKGGVITVVDEDCLFCRIDGKSYTAKRHAYYTRIPVPGEAPEVDLT